MNLERNIFHCFACDAGGTVLDFVAAMERVDSSLLLPNACCCLMKNVTRPRERDGWQIEEATKLGNQTRIDRGNFGTVSSGRPYRKEEILDEFVKVTGFHRKHAIRALKRSPRRESAEPRQRARIYNEAIREALTIVWEAADRICGKRLRQVIPGLIDAMERHGHLKLDAAVRESLLAMSAATMDRLLATARDTAKQGRRRRSINTALRKSIAVRTFGDWNDPVPGFLEMDMVVHCGKSTAGSYLHSLVLTDIASGWTDAIAMVVREQTLVTESVSEVRTKLPFAVRGLDVDNDSAFINNTLVEYCQDNNIELTRCRAYKKNDQAWIEQKNGAVIRRMVGYGRLEGAQTAATLNKLYASARLFVNFFQPSFKLISKTREGAKVIKKYHPPATPCERLLERKDVSDECKEQLRRTLAELDPVDY